MKITMLAGIAAMAALTSAAVIAGSAACGTSTTAHQPISDPASATTSASASAAATASPAPAAGAQSACAGLGGTVDANQICQVHSTTSNYTIDMSFPLDYPDQKAVIDYLTQDRADFVDWFTKFVPDGRNRPYEHVVTAKTYRSGTPTCGTQSLVLEIDDDTGAAHQGHPNTWLKAFYYDLSRHAPITFDTLFKPGTDPLEVLNPIVQRELGNHPETPLKDLDANTYPDFAITDDAVIFFFGQDQVIPDNKGPQQISATRAELAPVLA
jgi:Protein of unknown function (DUF3298)